MRAYFKLIRKMFRLQIFRLSCYSDKTGPDRQAPRSLQQNDLER
jgi:hypothetical protein